MAKKARLEAFVGLNTTGFTRGMRRMRAALMSINRGFSAFMSGLARVGRGLMKFVALTVAAGAAVVAFVSRMAKFGDDFAKMARRTGFSARALAQWQHAAELSGGSVEGLRKAVTNMARFLDDSRNGLAEAERSMRQLGLTFQDFDGLSPEEAFAKFADAIAGVVDPLERAALAQRVFGRSGQELLPMLDGGVEALRAMRAEADRLNLAPNERDLREAEEFNDNWLRTRRILRAIFFEFAGNFLPAINAGLTRFNEVLAAWRAGQGLGRFVTDLRSVTAALLAAGEYVGRILNPRQWASLGQLILGALRIGADYVYNKIREAFGLAPSNSERVDAARRRATEMQDRADRARELARRAQEMDIPDEGKRAAADAAAMAQREATQARQAAVREEVADPEARAAAAYDDLLESIADAGGVDFDEILQRWLRRMLPDPNAEPPDARAGRGAADMDELADARDAGSRVDELRNIGANLLGGRPANNERMPDLTRQLIRIAERQRELLDEIADNSDREGVAVI